MTAGSAAAISAGAAKGDARRIGVLFMIGSSCFAVASLPDASSISDEAVGVVSSSARSSSLRRPSSSSGSRGDRGRRSGSAAAAYVVPNTDEMINAAPATSMTLVGALCFLWAARILVKPPPWLLPRSVAGRPSNRPEL